MKHGNTSCAMATALQLAVDHNIKVLLVSTACNDNTMLDALWKEKRSALSLLGVSKKNTVEGNGIDELERMYRSNKLTSNIIKNYAKIVLTNRLEVLLGTDKPNDTYEELKNNYSEILNIASQYYDYVIVDLDKNIGAEAQSKILKNSTIIITTVSQKYKDIMNTQEMINKGDILNAKNTMMLIGKYMSDTKYNAKNITRNLLKSKKMINTIPYSKLLFEASQEGTLVDVFLMLMQVKESDSEFEFTKEIKRLISDMEEKILILERGY